MMKPLLWLFPLSALILTLVGCADRNADLANDPYGTGPFDADGNYREEWADDPTKWRRPGSRKPATPREEPPFIAKNDQPPPNSTPLPPAKPTTSAPKPTTAAKPTTPKPTVAAKPKPKPKPVVVKPKTVRHIVKKGDTLSAIAKRYGSSVSAIQKANRISGSLIFPNQSLVIPKR